MSFDPTQVGLPEAIREVKNMATAAAKPEVRDIKVTDAHGKEITIPVVFLPGVQGAQNMSSLAPVIRDGLAIAREQRLETAAGPDALIGTAKLATMDSMIEHIKRFKLPATVVYADPEELTIRALYDYHPKAGEAGWNRHGATYEAMVSDAWEAWGGLEGRLLSQEEFINLLDSRDGELVEGEVRGTKTPTPSWLLTFAGNLETYHNRTAKLTRDPNTGRRTVTFSDDKGIQGTVTPPTVLLVKIPVFTDSWEAESLEVRLRVQVEEGEPQFKLWIHDAAKVLAAEFNSIAEAVTSKEVPGGSKGGADVPLFMGKPESKTAPKFDQE